MKRIVVSAVFAAAWSAAVAAQSSGAMDRNQTTNKTDRMNNMGTMADATYIGCLEAASAEGTFRLTHADRMGDGSMKPSAMTKEAMNKSAMSHEMMAPTSLNLTSASVDLRKSVGRKVSVTGSAPASMHKGEAEMDSSAFTVKTLKVVAASCS